MTAADQGPGEGTRLLSIQYLRAIAAILVVIYHAMIWGGRQFYVGAAGVDVFFVISGFILWTIAHDRPVAPGLFLARRLARVAPLYWIITLAVLAIKAAWPPVFLGPPQTWDDILLSFAFVQHLDTEGGPFPVLSVGWSLNYEAVFYLVFAACLFAPTNRRLKILAACLVAIALFGFIVPISHLLLANFFFLQFLAGVILAWLRFEDLLPSRRAGWIMAGLGAALFAALAPFDIFINFFRAFIWGVPAVLLVAGLVTVETRGGIPRLPILKLLGDASYSIYLSHLITVELLTHVTQRFDPTYPPLAVLLATVAGVGVHFAIERPLLERLRPGRARASG